MLFSLTSLLKALLTASNYCNRFVIDERRSESYCLIGADTFLAALAGTFPALPGFETTGLCSMGIRLSNYLEIHQEESMT